MSNNKLAATLHGSTPITNGTTTSLLAMGAIRGVLINHREGLYKTDKQALKQIKKYVKQWGGKF